MSEFLFNVFFYALTFFLLYLAISLPPTLRAEFSQRPLYLDQARLFGPLLPHALITGEQFQVHFIAIAFVLYIPLLWLSAVLSDVAAGVLDHFVEMNGVVWRRVQLSVFTILSLLLASASVYAFTSRTWKESLIVVGVVVLGLFAWLASGQGTDKNRR